MARIARDKDCCELQKVVRLLGGSKVLPRRFRNALDAHDLLVDGCPWQQSTIWSAMSFQSAGTSCWKPSQIFRSGRRSRSSAGAAIGLRLSIDGCSTSLDVGRSVIGRWHRFGDLVGVDPDTLELQLRGGGGFPRAVRPCEEDARQFRHEAIATSR